MSTGAGLALASAAAWAGANVGIQGASRRLGSVGAVFFGQLAGGAAVILAAALVEGAPHLPARGALVALAIAGLASTVAYAGLFEALRRGDVSVVTPVISSWSLVSVAVSIAMRGALPHANVAFGAALVVAGNVLVARGSGAKSVAASAGEKRIALVFAALAALGFGAMVPAIDTVGAEVGRLWAIPLTWGIEMAIGLPLALRYRLLGSRPRGSDWPVVAAAGLLEAAGFVGVSLALARAPVAVVSPLSSLSTAFTVLVGVVWLRERPPVLALAGAAVASIGVVLVNLAPG